MGRSKKEKNEDDTSTNGEDMNTEVAKEQDTSEKLPEKRKLSKTSGFAAFAASTQKKWGDNVVVASDIASLQVPRISFGNIALDIATFGGLAQGRMTRLFGLPKSAKTGTALNAAVEVQNHCSICMRKEECNCDGREPAGVLWVDAEGRSGDNLSWMLAHGFQYPERLLIQQPPTGEQVVDLIDAAIRDSSAGIGMIVLDSIANVVSSAEINKATEDGGVMGRNAMLINSAMRKWTASLNSRGIAGKSKPTMILLNQIRNKLDGYGCFHGDTKVTFANGEQIPIRRVVNEKLKGPVLSWDGANIVEREITAWHKNGKLGSDERWLTFRVEGAGGTRGAQGFTCTPNHIIVNSKGEEVRADTLKEGDEILSWYESKIHSTERDVFIGSMFGDGGLFCPNGRKTMAFMALSNNEQEEYLEYKLSMLPSLSFTKRKNKEHTYYTSAHSLELGNYHSLFYSKDMGKARKYRHIPLDLLENASLLTLAIWYMDDGNYREERFSGSISVKRLSHDHARSVAEVLSKRYPCEYRENSRSIVLLAESFRKFSKDISKYVPTCMKYKLCPNDRTVECEKQKNLSIISKIVKPVKILQIHQSTKKMRDTSKYDLTIAENSFYLVGGDSRGVIVHNSPDVLPGGMGQGFATSLDIRFTKRAIHYLVANENGTFTDKAAGGGAKGFTPTEDAIPDYSEIEFKVVESSMCPKGRYGTFNYWLRQAHDHRVGDPDNCERMFAYAKTYNLFQKVAGGYTWRDLKESTQDKLYTAFCQNKKMQDEVWKEIVELLKK